MLGTGVSRFRRASETEIVRQLYECLTPEGRLPRLLGCFSRAFDSTYSALLTRNRLTGAVKVTASDFLPPEQQRAYESYYAHLRPLSFFACDDFGEGKIFSDQCYCDYDGYVASEIYNDFFRPLHADHLLFLVLRRDRHEDKSLVMRRSRKVGFYGPADVKRLRRLSDHLRNAERLALTIEVERNRATNLGAMFDKLDRIAFTTDRTGVILHATAAAERFLEQAEPFTVRNNRLVCRHAGFDRDLHAAIRECADSLDDAGSVAWRTLLSPRASNPPMSVSISAIFWKDEAAGGRLPACLIVIGDDPRGNQLDAISRVAHFFKLTPAETKVATALCQGRSIAAHALATGTSVLTARTLLKRVLEKTETHSQAELVSTLLRNAGNSRL